MAYYPQITTSVPQPFMSTSYAQGFHIPVNRFELFHLKTSQALEFLSNRITSLEQSLLFSVNETKERTSAFSDQLKILGSLSDKHFMEKSDLDALSQRFDSMEQNVLKKVELIEALIQPRQISTADASTNTKHKAVLGTTNTVRVWLAGFRSRGRSEKEIFANLAEILQVPLLNAQRGGHGWLLFDAPREEFHRIRSLKLGREHDFPSGLKVEMARIVTDKIRPRKTIPISLHQTPVVRNISHSPTRSGEISVPTTNPYELLGTSDQTRTQKLSEREFLQHDPPADIETSSSLSDPESPPAGSRSRRRDRNPAKDDSNISPQPAILEPPGRFSGKAGALTSTAPQDESRSSVVIPSREVIEADYDLDSEGHWTFRTKKLCISPFSEGLKAIEVDGCGNCFWECLTKAKVTLPNLVTRSGAQTYSSPPEHYTEYKRRASEFLRSSNFEALHKDPNFAIDFPVYADLSQPARLAELEHALTTDGAFSNEHVLQTAALALRININVESLETPGVVLETYSGQRDDPEARRQVRLLHRRDAQHPIFTTNFEPLRNRQGKLELSEGHFWLISKAKESRFRQERSHRGNTRTCPPGNV